MVAYNFHKMFAPQVEVLTKWQTIRAHRKRHARPGEPVQLYTGMRTRHCRKLIDPDPTCVRVVPIEIRTSAMIDDRLVSISVNGHLLDRSAIELFARADGFAPEAINGLSPLATGATARENMGKFWVATHGEGRFDGVLIRWRPT